MRVARFRHYGPPGVLQVEAGSLLDPPPGCVRVRVHAAALNPVDCKIRSGMLRVVARHPPPQTTGLDLSGVVDVVGEGVTHLRPGQEVWGCTTPGHGTCGDYSIVPASHLATKPEGLSHAESAALAMVGQTVLQAFELVDFAPGSRLLVLGGSGGVGSVAVQLARAAGWVVSATCSGPNVEWVRRLGATDVVDYRTDDPSHRLPPQDCVLDTVGDPVLARRCLRRGGTTLALVGGIARMAERIGPTAGTVLALGTMGYRRVAARARGRRLVPVLRRPRATDLDRLRARVEAGHLEPCIEAAYPLDRIVEAHRHVESGRTRGKVVVSLDP